MDDQTLAEIYKLVGVEADVLMLQCAWASAHKSDKRAMKLAGAEWGRKAKSLAYVYDTWRNDLQGATRHQIMSLLLIAELNKFERPMLYEDWRNKTMSYEDVREAVQARKQRTSKATKEPKRCPHCGEVLP